MVLFIAGIGHNGHDQDGCILLPVVVFIEWLKGWSALSIIGLLPSCPTSVRKPLEWREHEGSFGGKLLKTQFLPPLPLTPPPPSAQPRDFLWAT